MKTKIVFGMAALMAASLMAADTSPKDDVTAAAKALADKGSYSWKQTMDLGPNSQFTPGPTEGKTEKDGYTQVNNTFNDNTMTFLLKGTNFALHTEDNGWQGAADLADAQGPGRFMAARARTFKAPAAEVEDLISKTKEIKKDSGVYVADLTEDGAKSLLSGGFGGRRGGNQSPPTDAKGSVKFWITDGVITKYESKVSGKREIQGETRDVERNTTVEIKDVGTTKIDVPDEAKKKLSS